MASLGHVAVGLAGGRAYAGRAALGPMLGFSALSLLADADVIGMALGVPYGSPFGHRGASHALLVALLVGASCALLPRGPQRWRAAIIGAGVAASHPLLDAMTTGGHGVALLWPLSDARIFFPFRPIPVAPIGFGMLSSRGLYVLGFEALLFSPALLYALWPRRSAGS